MNDSEHHHFLGGGHRNEPTTTTTTATASQQLTQLMNCLVAEHGVDVCRVSLEMAAYNQRNREADDAAIARIIQQQEQQESATQNSNTINNNRKRAPTTLEAGATQNNSSSDNVDVEEERPRREKRQKSSGTISNRGHVPFLPSAAPTAVVAMPYAATAAAVVGSPFHDSFPLQQTLDFSPSPYRTAVHVAAATQNTNDGNIQQKEQQKVELDSAAVAAIPAAATKIKKKKTWNDHYLELQLFKQAHGHVFVPHMQPAYASLYNWVALQKSLLRKEMCPLTLEQVNRLVQVGIGGTARAADAKTGNNNILMGPTHGKLEKDAVIWEARFAELKEFYAKFKTLEVPKTNNKDKKSSTSEYYALARWVETQRMNFKNRTGELPNQKKRGVMTGDQLQRLAALGFRFTTTKKIDFATRFAQISAYQKEHGHTIVPRSYAQHDNLGTWVAGIQKQYKRHTLAADKVEQLHSIGFDFSVRCPPNAQRQRQSKVIKQPQKDSNDNIGDEQQQQQQQEQHGQQDEEKPRAKPGRKKGGADAAATKSKAKPGRKKDGAVAASATTKPKAKPGRKKDGAVAASATTKPKAKPDKKKDGAVAASAKKPKARGGGGTQKKVNDIAAAAAKHMAALGGGSCSSKKRVTVDNRKQSDDTSKRMEQVEV